ncbi:MAG: EAL domain-containing protein [Ruminococcaceae bacterium]|nr:EAL domain-containing protein [Oscillospiraceae bacterium]
MIYTYSLSMREGKEARRRLEGERMEKYRFEENILRAMEDSRIPFAVYQFINKRVVTLALSAGFCSLLGLDDRAKAYELMDNDMYRDAHPDDVARIADVAYRFATEGGEYDTVYRTRAPGGRGYIILHSHGEHVYMPTGERLAVIWYTNEGRYTEGGVEKGIGAQFSKALREASFTRRSYYDNLTGLPNMSYFFELAEKGRAALAAKGRRTAMLFLDLCGMKAFNRKHGFEEGGQLIRAFSREVARFFGNENCGHFGGDHFGVYTDAEGVEDRLAKLFAACYDVNGGKSLPVRAGISFWDDEAADASGVCDHAKMACDALRGVYYSTYRYFSEFMLKESAKRQYFIDNLDRAIDEGWIQAYYQPIIRAANGHVCNEEALARWIDPEGGIFAPMEFTPVLEEANLIHKLDLYMVEQVMEKMNRQQEEGLYIVPTSVNFSRSDFDCCDLVEEVRRRVDEAGIGRDMLVIELTESVIGSDFEYMRAQVDRFHALGFKVWMDDFGNGYSSLDVLQSIHFDLIKFDVQFMSHFDHSEKCRIILTELMKMAIGLDIDTVTEGVETAAQVAFLREIGCTRLQGYFYGKPIPMEEILDRYRTGRQIGFENPDEAGYYAAIGKINLYDLAVVANEDVGEVRQYFDTLPMAILETDGEEVAIVRCNKSYRDFMERQFGADLSGKRFLFSEFRERMDQTFLGAARTCGRDGNSVVLDEALGTGRQLRAFMRRLAVNPVTGVAAVVAVVLSVE